MNRVVVVATGCLLAGGACSRSSSTGPDSTKDAGPGLVQRLHPLNERVAATMDGIGAGRLFLDPANRWLTVENVEWRQDTLGAFTSDIPPVLRTVDLIGKVEDQVANGWRLTGPSSDGAITYVAERDEEYRYWLVSSTSPTGGKRLEAPEGWWIFDGAVSAGSRGVVLLSQRRAGAFAPIHWLATIDPASLAVVASARRDVPLARINLDLRVTGLAGARTQPRIVLLHGSGAEWTAEAVDVDTMATAWSTALPVQATDKAGVASVLRAGVVAIAGDDSAVLVALGVDRRVGVDAMLGFVLDLKTGAVTRTVAAAELQHVPGVIADVAPTPGQPAVTLLQRHSHTEPRATAFAGVAEVNLATGAERTLLEVAVGPLSREAFGRLRLLDPRALAVGASGVIVAPRSEGAALQLGAAYRPAWLLDEEGEGRERASVRGLVATPFDWHHQERPRVYAAANLPPGTVPAPTSNPGP